MSSAKFAKITVGFIETNCYLVPSENDSCLYIIDPGADPVLILQEAAKYNFKDFRILLTHGHVDHISAVKEIMKALPVSKLYLHKNDLPLYMSPENSVPPWIPAVKNPPLPETEMPDCDFRIISVPGHTRGGVCFYFESIPALFTGDTIFRNSVGRTDLPGGSQLALMKSIKENIFTLPEGLMIYPGHGTETSVGTEKKKNPHCQDLDN